MTEKEVEMELQQKSVRFTITDSISNKRRRLAEHRNNATLQLAPVFTPVTKLKSNSLQRHTRDTAKSDTGQSSNHTCRLNSYQPQKLASDKTLKRRRNEAVADNRDLIAAAYAYFFVTEHCQHERELASGWSERVASFMVK